MTKKGLPPVAGAIRAGSDGRSRHGGDGVEAERPERERGGVRGAGDVAQERPQRVGDVELLVAEGADHQRPGGCDAAEQEAQEVDGALVGPVEVVDDEHRRGRLQVLVDGGEDLVRMRGAAERVPGARRRAGRRRRGAGRAVAASTADRTRPTGEAARRARASPNACIRAVLPAPGSPVTITMPPRPSRARCCRSTQRGHLVVPLQQPHRRDDTEALRDGDRAARSGEPPGRRRGASDGARRWGATPDVARGPVADDDVASGSTAGADITKEHTMKRFIIEREIPGASELTEAQLAEVSKTSNAAVDVARRPVHLGQQLRRRRQGVLRPRGRGRGDDPRARPPRRLPRQRGDGGRQRVRAADGRARRLRRRIRACVGAAPGPARSGAVSPRRPRAAGSRAPARSGPAPRASCARPGSGLFAQPLIAMPATSMPRAAAASTIRPTVDSARSPASSRSPAAGRPRRPGRRKVVDSPSGSSSPPPSMITPSVSARSSSTASSRWSMLAGAARSRREATPGGSAARYR